MLEKLLESIRKFGAGWWDEWRDSAEAKAKAVFHALLNTVETDAQPALIAAGNAAKDAALTAHESGASLGDVEKAALTAAEASLSASGKVIAGDAVKAVVAAVVASVVPPPSDTDTATA